MIILNIIYNIYNNIYNKILKKNFLDEEYKQYLLYLCGSEALPLALNEEQEKDLIKRLGHEENAKQQLIEHNLRLVVYIARKFENSDAELEDLISVGSIGLIKAINSYKSDKNIKIATYASKCIENEILMHLRKISKQKKEISINDSLNIDGEGNELTICDILPSKDEDPENQMLVDVEKQILWKIVKSLNTREQEIIIMRFGLNGDNELTQKEVATNLGISQSYISRLEKKIVSRIKKEMQKVI